ncbi:hypothetical protein RHSIM_RhsimUnG0068900 [Rhododendron simsii]|uniref:Uncharacterized protein n=1 Tax=Rhododendron simsii TaxID=118357 RepID=A0A834FWB2_RHOSS|nr:hypothetical protein RHSIM_RhsimUnG0068900 [Rhododendron simsii]
MDKNTLPTTLIIPSSSLLGCHQILHHNLPIADRDTNLYSVGVPLPSTELSNLGRYFRTDQIFSRKGNLALFHTQFRRHSVTDNGALELGRLSPEYIYYGFIGF